MTSPVSPPPRGSARLALLLTHPLCLALLVRSLGLLLPHTYFQPDEFWQALEPAHVRVFGYGFLSWEWRALPGSTLSTGSAGLEWGRTGTQGVLADAYERWVIRGQLRSWAWPGVFVGVYKALRLLGLDETEWLVVAPRIVGVLVAALTDWTTHRLALKLLGPGASAAALFLSLTNLFNNHALPRLLATSPETLLTTLAVLHFPLPGAERPPPVVLMSTKGVKGGSSAGRPGSGSQAKTAKELDHAMMDRAAGEPDFVTKEDSLVRSVVFAALAICLRPTTLPFWLYMGGELLWRRAQHRGVKAAFVSVLMLSTAIDYALSGQLAFPILTFFHYNIVQNISAFYGQTNIWYHLVQTLPILLVPIWWWWAQGFLACLLPTSFLPHRLQVLDRPAPLRTLARALTFAITAMSLSPHSEWRFLHPFLTSLLLFALPALFHAYHPGPGAMISPVAALRQYTRLPQLAFYGSLACIVPWLYLNKWHGRGAVEVMNVLRRGTLGPITGLAVLTNCHGTPWMSHLHQDVPAWFLTCEPPLQGSAQPTWQQTFDADPVGYMRTRFPAPPNDRSHAFRLPEGEPSHLVLYGALLDARALDGKVGDADGDFKDVLHDKGYREVWRGSMGPDIFWDSDKKGGVRVWQHT